MHVVELCMVWVGAFVVNLVVRGPWFCCDSLPQHVAMHDSNII